jgi:hypothetical protein
MSDRINCAASARLDWSDLLDCHELQIIDARTDTEILESDNQ